MNQNPHIQKFRAGAMAAILATTSLIALPEVAHGQTDETGFADTEDFSGAIRTAPRPNIGAPSLATQFGLNGAQLSFTGGRNLSFGLEGGSNRNTIPDGRLDIMFGEESDQNLTIRPEGSRLDLTQRAWVFQMRSIDRRRTVRRSIDEDVELIGFKLDYSVTGRCYLSGTQPDDYCTYTPGLATFDGGYDPDTLVPTGFEASTNFGQVIPESVHTFIQSENEFQRGPEGGPLVGISFDIPNSGFTAAGDTGSAFGLRDETVRRRPVLSLSRVDQTLSTSSVEAAATRTTRAFVLPNRDEVDGAYLLMQLAAWVLPSAPSGVPAAAGTPNVNVSNNLFFALNNARVPADSFTLFQTGRASLRHPAQTPRSAKETPTAMYHGFWMGLSPVRDIRRSTQERFTLTGERTSINSPIFEQGGIGTPFEDILNSGVVLFDELDGSIQSVNFQNIDDLFIQIGLDVSTQEAVRRITTTETTRYKLVPHLAVSGNKTGGESVFRYYAGMIHNSKPNAYIGADYSLQTETGWGAYARLDVYSRPDQDYFSELELRGQRRFSLAPQRELTLGVGGVFALDSAEERRNESGRFTLLDQDSRVDFSGRLREGNVDFTLRQRFASNGGGSWRDSTTFGLAYANQENFSVNAQVTPISSERSYVQGSLGLNVQLGDNSNSPVLQAQYARVRYDLGRTSAGQSLSTTENIFRAGFSTRF